MATNKCPHVRIKELERELAAEKKRSAALLELCHVMYSPALINALLAVAREDSTDAS